MIVDEFAELSATQRPLVMSIVLHSFITGVPFRLRAVRGERLSASRPATACGLRRRVEIHQAVVDSRALFPPVAEANVATEPVAALTDFGRRWCATALEIVSPSTSTCRSGRARSSAWLANPVPVRACLR